MSGLIRRRSLVFRLLLLSVAAVAFPALLISAVYQSISTRVLLGTIEQKQTELGRRLGEEVNGEIQQARGLVALVARSSFFAAGSRVDQYEALHNLLDSSPAFQEAMLVSPSGMELLKVSRRGGFARLVRRTEDLSASYVGLPFFSGNRVPTILLGEPLKSFANPTRKGALLVKMSFTTLNGLMRQAPVGAHGLAYVIDSRGALLAHPDEDVVFRHPQWAKRPVVSAWIGNPNAPSGLIHEKDDLEGELLSLAYPIPLLKSAVVIQQPRADVYAPLEQMRKQFILWTCLSVVLFLSIALAVAWRILMPLRLLKKAVEEVGEGKRDIHLNIHTHDELEELGNTFEKMTQSLGELERMRRDLISMVVHDLKMPLSTILPSLENLLAGDLGKLTADQTYFVMMARRSGMEMLMLIQNLLDVAKMEEGKLALSRELFAPADWAKSVVANFIGLAESAKKKLTLRVGADLSPLEGDSALLSRVLGNLITNALRHTTPGSGEVAVSLYRDGTQLAVEVRDNGEGIPAAEQERIFERFVQGQGRRASLKTGTGLGLTFCKLMVEAHGGQITLFSEPREGSVFTFRLPVVELPAEWEPEIAVPSTH